MSNVWSQVGAEDVEPVGGGSEPADLMETLSSITERTGGTGEGPCDSHTHFQKLG